MKSFSANELTKNGVYPTFETWYGGPQPQISVYNTPVTPMENLQLFLSGKPAYWIPNMLNDVNYITPDVVPDTIASGYEGGVDSFGVVWEKCSNPMLPALVRPGCPKLPDIENWRELPIPDVDSWDWNASGAVYSGVDRRRATIGVLTSGFFERLIALMEFENAAVALLEDPEESAALLDMVADYNIAVLEHYKKYYDIDMAFIHDDWGSQLAPFFSHSTLQETVVPAFKKFNARAKELGVPVIHHCCGHSAEFIPEMMDIGSVMWQLQLNANPEIVDLLKAYQGKGFFFDVAVTLPAGLTDEEFRAKSTEIYKTYGIYNNACISICDETYVTTEAQNDILYELSRKAMTGEL